MRQPVVLKASTEPESAIQCFHRKTDRAINARDGDWLLGGQPPAAPGVHRFLLGDGIQGQQLVRRRGITVESAVPRYQEA